MSSLPTELDFAANPAATPARMNKAMDYLIARLKAVESLAPGIEDAINTLNTIGLERISATLVPLSEQANAIVGDLATIKAMWESDNTFAQAVATVEAAVTDAFADYRHRYLGAKASAPTLRDDGTAVDVGDMYFDIGLDQMRVLGAGGWKNASSAVSGILNQIAPMVATDGQTVFPILGGYDVGYIIVTVNGVVATPASYTATDGANVVFGAGQTAGAVVGGIAFGAVSLSSIYTKAQIDAGFAVLGSSYTKGEADVRFALVTDAYTKSASDSRYAKNDFSNLTSAASARSSLGLGGAAVRNDTFFLQSASNLSDLANAATARANLGLGAAATRPDTYFCQATSNLSELTAPATARTNLGLGSAAVRGDTFFLQAANNLSDVGNVTTARGNLGLKSGALVNITVSTSAPATPAEGDVWINA